MEIELLRPELLFKILNIDLEVESHRDRFMVRCESKDDFLGLISIISPWMKPNPDFNASKFPVYVSLECSQSSYSSGVLSKSIFRIKKDGWLASEYANTVLRKCLANDMTLSFDKFKDRMSIAKGIILGHKVGILA